MIHEIASQPLVPATATSLRPHTTGAARFVAANRQSTLMPKVDWRPVATPAPNDQGHRSPADAAATDRNPNPNPRPQASIKARHHGSLQAAVRHDIVSRSLCYAATGFAPKRPVATWHRHICNLLTNI